MSSVGDSVLFDAISLCYPLKTTLYALGNSYLIILVENDLVKE